MNTHSATNGASTNRALKFQVYIDATIPSYFVAAPSREPKIAEWQRITRAFWQDPRFEFILSDSVVGEISFGDRKQAQARLNAVADLTVLRVRHFDRAFAQQLVNRGALPQKVFTDAVHIAVAASHALPYLATWNFTHLANPHTRSKIEEVCREVGYSPPRIDSPAVILQAAPISGVLHEGGTPMISPHDPAKDIYEAKERLVALFGDLETYMDFMMKRQEKLIKQGVKFVDLPEVRVEPPKKSDD